MVFFLSNSTTNSFIRSIYYNIRMQLLSNSDVKGPISTKQIVERQDDLLHKERHHHFDTLISSLLVVAL